jgi:hypothetical protein
MILSHFVFFLLGYSCTKEFKEPAEKLANSYKEESKKTWREFKLFISSKNSSSSHISADIICDNYSSNFTQEQDIKIVENKTCFIIINNFEHEGRTFIPMHTALTIEISPDGTVLAKDTLYRSANLGLWLMPTPSEPFALNLNISLIPPTRWGGSRGHADPPTSISMVSIPLSISFLPGPTVTNLGLFIETGINFETTTSYTLVATVIGSTGCKYILASPNSITTWTEAGIAYNSDNALDCPILDPSTPGFAEGNWNSQWESGNQYVMIWISTINGLSSYTYSNLTSSNSYN